MNDLCIIENGQQGGGNHVPPPCFIASNLPTVFMGCGGCCETKCKKIRIHVLGEWRVIDVAKIRDAIYVLHAFQKKMQKTSQRD
jgi:hypothetical protein